MAASRVTADAVSRAVQCLTLRDKNEKLQQEIQAISPISPRYWQIINEREQRNSPNVGFVVCFSNPLYKSNKLFTVCRFPLRENVMAALEEHLRELKCAALPYPLRVHCLISCHESQRTMDEILKVMRTMSQKNNDVQPDSFHLDVPKPMDLLRDIFCFGAMHGGGRVIIHSDTGIRIDRLHDIFIERNSVLIDETFYPFPTFA